MKMQRAMIRSTLFAILVVFGSSRALVADENLAATKQPSATAEPKSGEQTEPPAAAATPNKRRPAATKSGGDRDFEPSEEISEDYSVPFPVDI